MSGCLGVLSTSRAPVDGELVVRMTAAMAFRGPDAEHTWTGATVGLGHTRLRASDAEDRAQPCSLDGEVWITADARIDGRTTLVPRLRARGRDVSAATPDAELILHAYLAWGDRFLDELIGDFAFVLWDQRRHTLVAARDQLGVAQLFYAEVDGALLVGNTLQSLLAHPGVAGTLDERTLADVALFTTYLDDAASAYSGVGRVPPGHRLVHDGHGLRVERYWELAQPAPLRYRRPEEHAEHFRVLFDAAVEDRLRTDRVGAQLSGGMDSTSIAVTAHDRLLASGRPFDLRGYTIEYRSLIADEEGALAAQVGAAAGFPVEILTGERYLGREAPADPGWVPPEPGAGPIWGMAEICRRTASFAPVLLTGYGGDPLLSPPLLTWRRTCSALGHGDWRWPLRRIRAGRRQRQGCRQVTARRAWVNPDWARRVDLDGRAELFRQRAHGEQTGLAGAPRWRTLFAWADAGYNGFAVSIRFPFLDLRLLQFVLAVPPTPWLHRKRLLRDAVGHRLPADVLTRPKTVMPGDVGFEHIKRAGIPAWELEALGAPEMAPFIDQRWLAAVRAEPPPVQAHIWATQQPPVPLAHWFRARRATPTEEVRHG